MPYGIVDVELTEPLPSLSGDGLAGIALILRRKDRVIGFIMEPIRADGNLGQDELARLIASQVGTQLLQESLREQLPAPPVANRLPSLTVAICTRDRTDSLRQCLRSLVRLREQTGGDQWDFSVLVVDNAPSDEQTRQLVGQFSNVRYTCEVRPGLNFARNRALHEAEGDLIAYLDDDVTVDRGWLRGLQEAWSENPDAAAFTGQVLPRELETEAQILFEQRGGFRHGFDKVRYTASVPDEEPYLYPCRTGIFGVGCNMAFRRKVLLELGGFDEALDTGQPLPGGGDHDIFYQVIRAGHPLVYEPTYLVYHQHRRTMQQLRRQYGSWGQSVMAFAGKAYADDPPLRRRWRKLMVAWFVAHIQELGQAMLGRHVLPVRFLVQELWGGVVGWCGEYGRSRKRTEQIRRDYP
jgi:glycosyltransferase involved in cell wall biosynthesis